jgi:hypothetical protein
MTDFDNTIFTEKILEVYAKALQTRLPRVKFILDDGKGVEDAAKLGMFRLLGNYTASSISIDLDDHMRADGGIDEDGLAKALAEALSEPVIFAAETELQPEEDDPIKRIGAGQLWIVHKLMAVLPTHGVLFHGARSSGIEVCGKLWYDTAVLKNKFLAQTLWILARSGEIVKEEHTTNVL